VPFDARLTLGREVGDVLRQAVADLAFSMLDVGAKLSDICRAYAMSRTDRVGGCLIRFIVSRK